MTEEKKERLEELRGKDILTEEEVIELKLLVEEEEKELAEEVKEEVEEEEEKEEVAE